MSSWSQLALLDPISTSLLLLFFFSSSFLHNCEKSHSSHWPYWYLSFCLYQVTSLSQVSSWTTIQHIPHPSWPNICLNEIISSSCLLSKHAWKVTTPSLTLPQPHLHVLSWTKEIHLSRSLLQSVPHKYLITSLFSFQNNQTTIPQCPEPHIYLRVTTSHSLLDKLALLYACSTLLSPHIVLSYASLSFTRIVSHVSFTLKQPLKFSPEQPKQHSLHLVLFIPLHHYVIHIFSPEQARNDHTCLLSMFFFPCHHLTFYLIL